MAFRTRITFKSGDGNRLDSVVDDIVSRAERKGVQLRGPHVEPVTKVSVPQYKGLPAQGTFEPWSYTVYTRFIEIVDHNEFVRTLTNEGFPDSLHVTVDVETI